MSIIWKKSSTEKCLWVQRFKDIFINQKEHDLNQVFNIEAFGIHNSVTLKDYVAHEFDEFKMKCQNFGLTMDANIVCYDLKDDFFYFALGKKEDSALFEAIFKWDEFSQLAIGNQYRVKIEPKIQFIKNEQGIEIKRKINFKPSGYLKIKQVINEEPSENNLLIKNELTEILGGNFYSVIYNRLSENNLTYWDNIQIYTQQGVLKPKILMRGIDHPLFQDNLYPEISFDGYSFTCSDKTKPVIIYVELESGENFYFKYPTQKSWNFDCKIKNVCLTDTLSFDWIVRKDSPY
jgi:hypothetical protein